MLATDEHGRLLLRTGIAGAATITSSGRRYDDDAVQRLRLRLAVEERELAEACPRGVLVVRLPRTMDLDLASPWRDVARQVTYAVTGQRPMRPLMAALTSVRIRAWGPLPFAATFVGYVALAADLTELGRYGHPRRRSVEIVRFHLRERQKNSD